jgi:hypothetical protein
VRARVEDPALVTPLRFLFPDYEVPAEAAASDDAVVVVRRSGAAWTVADGRAIHACATSTEVAEAVEFALTEAFLRLFAEAVQVHAAGVVLHRGATLLIGEPGAGKTSLAFWFSRRGCPVLGDDVAILVPGGRARAFKRLFKVDPWLIGEAGLSLDRTRLWEPGASSAWYDPTDGGGWADEAPVGAVALIERIPGAPERLATVPRSEALRAVLANRFATGTRGAPAFEILADAVRGAQTLRLSFDSAARGAELLATTLA